MNLINSIVGRVVLINLVYSTKLGARQANAVVDVNLGTWQRSYNHGLKLAVWDWKFRFQRVKRGGYPHAVNRTQLRSQASA